MAQRDALEALSTEDLRHRAFAVAERRLDVGFFWDLVKHLPASADVVDASAGGLGAGINETLALARELFGAGYGDAEPLLRERFVAYLIEHDRTGPPAEDQPRH